MVCNFITCHAWVDFSSLTWLLCSFNVGSPRIAWRMVPPLTLFCFRASLSPIPHFHVFPPLGKITRINFDVNNEPVAARAATGHSPVNQPRIAIAEPLRRYSWLSSYGTLPQWSKVKSVSARKTIIALKIMNNFFSFLSIPRIPFPFCFWNDEKKMDQEGLEPPTPGF